MYILGLDIGFGDVKVCLGDSNGDIVKKFKFPSLIGITKAIENVENNRIKEFDGNYYMVGNYAEHLPSVNLIDISEYKNLEYYAPLLLQHAVDICGVEPEIIVTGLSIAQIQNSGYFQQRIENYTINGKTYNRKIFVLPQGAGCKLTVDKFGANFPKPQTEFMGDKNYIILDIGFNTLDSLMISNGKTDPNLFEGVEKEGIMKIASKVAKLIYEKHKRQLTLHEAKEILDTNTYKLRGQRYDYSEDIKTIKDEYLKELLKFIEQKYPGFLDKCDFIFIAGGGSRLFRTSLDKFIRVPKEAHEFYNAIGEFLFGLTKI